MSGTILSTTRNDDGLYTLTVEQNNNSTLVLNQKYIRIDTSGSSLPSEAEEKEQSQMELDKMNGKKQKPEEIIHLYAKRLRSQVYLIGMIGAFLEKDEKNVRSVKAVYIPINHIDNDVIAKRMLAFLHSMFMTEEDVHKRLVQVTHNDPSKFVNNNDIIDAVFVSALYTPQFRLPYDIPSTAKDGITGDNRDFIRTLYKPQTIPSSPVVPRLKSNNPYFIVLAMLVIAAIIYYAMRK
jgi:hypothetical protein